MACRQAKKSDMAMIFMNRFLDLVEAIENDDGMLDPEGFEETEIPLEGRFSLIFRKCFFRDFFDNRYLRFSMLD